MKLPKDQPFLVSVVLHLIILIGFLIFTIVQAFWPKEKIHVFEVFDLPKEMSTSMETSLPMERPPNLPVADISEQIPTPQTLVSAEEFFKKNPRPEPKPRTAKKSVGIKVPQISVSDVVMKINTPNNPKVQLTSQQISALSAYNGRLRIKIDAAWAKPKQFAGLNLTAQVDFNVTSSGRISNHRLTKSSGYDAFDKSIMSAINRANTAGPTPTGQEYEYSLTFRMID